jgi:hypothetical protein
MRKAKFIDDQLFGVLREAEAGRPVKEVARANRIPRRSIDGRSRTAG